jgi:hypothetical protein
MLTYTPSVIGFYTEPIIIATWHKTSIDLGVSDTDMQREVATKTISMTLEKLSSGGIPEEHLVSEAEGLQAADLYRPQTPQGQRYDKSLPRMSFAY